MNDKITMMDEVSDVVRMLAGRMDTNPEDFVSGGVFGAANMIEGYRPVRFGPIFEAIRRSMENPDSDTLPPTSLLWYLNSAELALLREAAYKMSRRAFETGVLEILYRKDEPPGFAGTSATGLNLSTNLSTNIKQAMSSAIATGVGNMQLAQAEQARHLAQVKAMYDERVTFSKI